MAEKKSPINEPGLGLFSEENRVDKYNYAALKDSAIIAISNVGYNEIVYSPENSLASNLPARLRCIKPYAGQEADHTRFRAASLLGEAIGATLTVAKQHACELPQHIRNYPCYPSGSTAYNEVNESN